MDFFARQEAARKTSRVLLLYFFMAVVAVIAAVNALAFGVAAQGNRAPDLLAAWLHGPYAWKIALATLGVIALGSLWTALKLMQGGPAVARMMGARAIAPNTQNTDERRLINVVEEMAIASGVPMPAIYLMEREEGINAFAAGYKPTAAVVCVTQGALQKLTRHELQGVIGHEFSHILHGDMRINIRLISVLAGIQAIGKIGEFIMDISRSSGRSWSSNSDRKNSGGFFLIGLALWLIGYIGLFFGRLIKAALSRQREFLADASAVQFTRDPTGIAQALDKIGKETYGSALNSVNAEDVSHMCFGAIRQRWQSWFATHPPLEERIRAIDPHRKYQRTRIQDASPAPSETQDDVYEITSNFVTPAQSFNKQQISAQIGSVSPSQLAHAQHLHQTIPASLREAMHTAEHAPALIYALLAQHANLDALAFIGGSLTNAAAEHIRTLQPIAATLDPRLFLATVDLSLPALRQLSAEAQKTFLSNVDALVQADAKISPFEFALRCLLNKQLSPKTNARDQVRFTTFSAVMPDIRTLLSTLAHTSGHNTPHEASYQRAMQNFTQTVMPIINRSECTMHRLTRSLNRLAELSPLLKKPVIEACVDGITHDGHISVNEQELLRAICECLDCPMPLFSISHTGELPVNLK
jgi:Zn-dependent protease with chaperone function